jgi:type II secretion system protein J
MTARQRGFTLLELLVALGVLALLASIGWRGLDAILGAQASVQAETRRWSDADRVMQQIGRDLSLAVERPMEEPAGELVIVRMGEPDAGPTQSGPRRVTYRLRDGALQYVVELASSGSQAGKVLEGVAAFDLRALESDGAWRPLRREPGPVSGTARAVAAEITLAGGERIWRIFPLP